MHYFLLSDISHSKSSLPQVIEVDTSSKEIILLLDKKGEKAFAGMSKVLLICFSKQTSIKFKFDFRKQKHDLQRI